MLQLNISQLHNLNLSLNSLLGMQYFVDVKYRKNLDMIV